MLFIWIPKTGGTTFAKGIHPNMQIITEYDNMPPFSEDSITFGHACPRALMKEGIISKDMWKWHTVKCAIVRNPYGRFVSLFHDFKRTGRISQGLTQTQFARAIYEMDPMPGLFNSYQFSQCSPQTDWLIPGLEIYRFEDIIKPSSIHLNAGGHNDIVDTDAVPYVNDIYRADFTLLNYHIIDADV